MTEDVRVERVRISLSWIQALRAGRAGGRSVRIAIAAYHEALGEDLQAVLAFVDGTLVEAALGAAEHADVRLTCQYPALIDYLTGALSAAESVERERFAFDGPEGAATAALEELDAAESVSARAAADRELLTAMRDLIRAGEVPWPGSGLEVILAPVRDLPAHVVDELRRTHAAWERREVPAT